MTKFSNTPTDSSNGEVYGARVFYAAIVIGAALLLMGALWQPGAQEAANQTPVTQQA